uniref:RRM domain-containing protein n=1 Tax=Oryza glaberrima TaxID=4538 RepID=I1PI49_ORYGL
MVRARDSIREILPVFSIQSALGTADSAPAIRPVAAASDLVRISSEKSRLDLPVPFFFFFFFLLLVGGFQEKRGAASHGDYDEQDRRVKGAEVFVGGLPRSVTERALREVFSPCGEIVDLRIMKDQNGISKGYGFVRFAERECAYIAKRQINGFEARISNFLFDLQGKRLAVDLSLDQDTLFFGNLCKVLFDQH